jgi:hypothetical protein
MGNGDRRSARIVRRLTAVLLIVPAAGTLSACVGGPSTKEDVCSTFDELGTQLMKGNGVFGNPLFRKVDDLSGVAGRYDGVDLSSDSDALHRIAESDSTTSLEIIRATSRIADVCGHPLSSNEIFGG